MTGRIKVGDEFCGWDSLRQLYLAGKTRRDRLLILTLFKTGGRVSEVLNLSKSTIDLKTSETSVIVRGMTVLKKFSRTKDGILNLDVTRTFPVLRSEELSEEWLDLLEEVKHRIIFYGQHIRKPMTRDSALKIVKAAGDKVSMRVSAHWLRGMRASQLAEEYGFGEYELKQFFAWGSRNPRNIWERYAALGWRGLEKRMLNAT